MTTENLRPKRVSSSEEHETPLSRRNVMKGAGAIASAGGVKLALMTEAGAAQQPGCRDWTQPNDADFFATIGNDKIGFLDRALSVIEKEVVPKTQEGVRGGSKLFGAAVLKKADLSTVVASTNTEAGNPLLHGEIQTINDFYEIPKDQRPSAKDSIFISTHEPCPLCLSGISWAGFDNFFYLFTYEDSRDAYGIPHDLVMLEEVFRCPDGSYNENNTYWKSWGLRDLIATTGPKERAKLDQRVEALKVIYAEMSDIYQKAKAEGKGADVPLK